MQKVSYWRARSDHEYLWQTYDPAADMTGGYVDQDDLKKLLQNPTKSQAKECYIDQIIYWFQVGPESSNQQLNPEDKDRIRNDPRVQEIADRYDIDITLGE